MSAAVLHAQGFGVAFGERVILAELNFSVPDHGVTVLMGPAGTGKSTLLRSLAGLLQASPRFKSWGRIDYQDQPLSAHHHPALVVQNPRMLAARIQDSLAQRAREAGWQLSPLELRQRIHSLLTDHHSADLLPLLDQPALQLSSTQQRRVAILAELLAAPALLMLDEPTTGLPEEGVRQVMDLIRHIAQQRPVLVVLHHQQQARQLGQHILLLAGGRIQAQGDCAEFFTHPPHAVAAQFVRTGSCSVPSPDADPGTLDEAVTPPPPLPVHAVQPRPQARPPAPSPAPAAVHPPAAASTAAQPPRAAPPAPTPTPTLAAAPAATGMTPTLTLPPSVTTPADHAPPAYRGPRGFRWVVPGKIGTAPLPGAVIDINHDLAALRDVGVTVLITLTRRDLPQDRLAAHGLRNLHLPIYDREAPSISQLRMLAIRITRLIEQGEVLAVHCRAGLGRTGTVVAGWLIHEGLTADAALERIRGIDPDYVQSQAQEEFLHQLEASFLLKV